MNIAQKISVMPNWTDALLCADDSGVAIEQNWDNESTIFEFSDGSSIAFFGITQEVIVL